MASKIDQESTYRRGIFGIRCTGAGERNPVHLPSTLGEQGQTSDLLDAAILNFPDRSQSIDTLSGALKEDEVLSEFRAIHKLSDLREFSGSDREASNDVLFLIIHPEKHGKKWASITTHDDERGFISYSWSMIDQLTQCVEGFATNFHLIHGEGFDNQSLRKLEKAKGVNWLGSEELFDLKVGGKTISPQTPRQGSRNSDALMVVSIPIVEITKNGKYGNITEAKWLDGWQIFGLTNLSSTHRESSLQRGEEKRPLTRQQIKRN